MKTNSLLRLAWKLPALMFIAAPPPAATGSKPDFGLWSDKTCIAVLDSRGEGTMIVPWSWISDEGVRASRPARARMRELMTGSEPMCRPLFRRAIRIAWGLMLFAHLYWLVRSIGSPTVTLPSQLLLALTCVFLGLKVADVAALRFRCTRHSLIAAVLVVALLHVGVIDRMAGEPTDFPPWVLPVIVGALTCTRMGVVGFVRRLVIRLALAFGLPRPTWTRHYWHTLSGVLARCHQPAFGPLRIPRAPPV